MKVTSSLSLPQRDDCKTRKDTEYFKTKQGPNTNTNAAIIYNSRTIALEPTATTATVGEGGFGKSCFGRNLLIFKVYMTST